MEATQKFVDILTVIEINIEMSNGSDKAKEYDSFHEFFARNCITENTISIPNATNIADIPPSKPQCSAIIPVISGITVPPMHPNVNSIPIASGYLFV